MCDMISRHMHVYLYHSSPVDQRHCQGNISYTLYMYSPAVGNSPVYQPGFGRQGNSLQKLLKVSHNQCVLIHVHVHVPSQEKNGRGTLVSQPYQNTVIISLSIPQFQFGRKENTVNAKSMIIICMPAVVQDNNALHKG